MQHAFGISLTVQVPRRVGLSRVLPACSDLRGLLKTPYGSGIQFRIGSLQQCADTFT